MSAGFKSDAMSLEYLPGILCHSPPRSGWPSDARGVGATRSGFPSANRGSPGDGSCSHCAVDGRMAATQQTIRKVTRRILIQEPQNTSFAENCNCRGPYRVFVEVPELGALKVGLGARQPFVAAYALAGHPLPPTAT